MNHLSDPQIQSYLEGGFKGKNEIEEHLRVCRYCQNQLAMYKIIVSELRSDTAASFSPNFAESVIRKIEIARERKANFIESGLLAAAVIVGTGLTFYYANWKPLTEFLTEGYRRALEYFGEVTFTAPIPENWLGANTGVFLLAGAILILVGLMDNYLSKHDYSLK